MTDTSYEDQTTRPSMLGMDDEDERDIERELEIVHAAKFVSN